MEDTPVLASFSLTHVHYNANDPISYLCAWLALVPQALCVIYTTLIWSSREVEIILMGAGQFGCEVLNFLLKRMIKEQRPPQMNGQGYGMPSSHAQFTSYFATYLTLFLLLRHRPIASSSHTPFTTPQLTLLSLAALLSALIVSWSRIYLSYHSPIQVLAGCIAGAISAGLWFGVTEWARRKGWVEWGLEWELVRAVRVRDLVVEEDLVVAGWERWEGKKRARRHMNGREREGGDEGRADAKEKVR